MTIFGQCVQVSAQADAVVGSRDTLHTRGKSWLYKSNNSWASHCISRLQHSQLDVSMFRWAWTGMGMNNFVDTVRHDAVYSGYAVSCAIGQKLSGEHWRLQLKAFIEDYQLDTTTTGELCHNMLLHLNELNWSKISLKLKSQETCRLWKARWQQHYLWWQTKQFLITGNLSQALDVCTMSCQQAKVQCSMYRRLKTGLEAINRSRLIGNFKICHLQLMFVLARLVVCAYLSKTQAQKRQ